jgi:hypothetical protein
MIKYIIEVDTVWHDSDKELPTMSTDVEFMDRNNVIHKGGIQVDMAGHYPYLEKDYSSFDEMIKWRFIPNKDYPMYNERKKYTKNDD